MKSGRWRRLAVAAIVAALSRPGAAEGPRERRATGLVVERVVPGFEGAKAGIQPGDMLVSWERGPSPPANPAGARGEFRSPFDVDEVRFEQGPRARTLTLGLERAGRELFVSIGQYPWRVETRPKFSGKWLARYEEGGRLCEQGNLQKGLDAWRALAADLSAAGRHVDAAWLWSRVGMKLSGEKQPDAALIALGRALVEAKAAKSLEIEAQLEGLEVEVLRSANRLQEAQGPARRAIALRESVAPDGLSAAVALYELTTVLSDEVPEYEAASRRALQIRERLAPGSRFEADAVASLARFAEGQGDTRVAIELQRRALAIHEKLDASSPSVARGLSTLCAYQMNGGDLVEAEESCRRSVDVARSLGPASLGLVGQALHNLGVVARLRGEFDRAVRLFGQSMEIYEQLDPGGRMVAANHWDIAATEVSRRDVERLAAAEDHLRLSDLGYPGDERHAALTALVRADIAYQRKDLAGAEKQLRQALPYFDRLAPEGAIATDIVLYLGIVLTDEGRLADAEALLRRGLVNGRRFAPASQKTAELHHHLGMLLWKAGRVAEAEAAMRQALEDLEFQLGRLAASDEGSSSFGAQYADFYKAYAELLVEMRREQDAFLILERYRAGAFLRMLAQRDVAPPGELPEDLESQRAQVNAAYERVQGEIRSLDPKADAKKVDQGLAQLAELRARQAEVADRIREASPRYGALRYPRPLDLAGARGSLDPGTLLLSYAVGKEKTLLFAVTAGPGGGRPLSVFTLPLGDGALRESVRAYRRLIELGQASPALAARSQSLYDTLVRPAEALIGSSDRVLILPDGPLHRLPWASLVRTAAAGQPQYFVEGKPFATAVSATVFAELRKDRRERTGGGEIQMAAFGDPRYPASVARQAGSQRGEDTDSSEEPEAYGEPQVDAALRGGHSFQPLPYTREEVELIAALYEPGARVFLGDQATEERALSLGRNVSRFHYACHAYVNEKSPLDSALVFSIPEKPVPGRDNGLLQAWEIFEKVRIDADLVTLSACDSGLGKEMGGEGLIGLTRAFQYAGARSVLASLWKVDDRATAELMKRFYGNLKAGRSKDEALRLAQIELVRSSSFSQPKDWAAFQLTGDWK